MARLTRYLALPAALLVAGVGLAACGTGGAVTDARQSCVYVKRAIILENESLVSGISTGQQNKLQQRAINVLLKGTHWAADATTIDGSWNPLMTEINEAERVPIPNLEASLQRICKVANSKTPYLS